MISVCRILVPVLVPVRLPAHESRRHHARHHLRFRTGIFSYAQRAVSTVSESGIDLKLHFRFGSQCVWYRLTPPDPAPSPPPDISCSDDPHLKRRDWSNLIDSLDSHKNEQQVLLLIHQSINY